MLALQLKPLPARHEQLRPAELAEACDLARDLRQQVLGVVDQQERPLRGQCVDERLLDREAGALPHLERLRDGVERERRVAKRGERNPPDAVGDILGDLRRGLQRQPRLPCPAGARERQQPNVLAAQQADDLVELAPAAEERRRRDGEVRLVQRLQAREVGVAQLEEALRRREVLQTVLTEVANSLAGDEVARRLRQEHLPAVPGGGDPRRPVDVDADVALLGYDRLAGVEPHAHADRPAAERRLPVGGGRDRLGGARERDEERVALRVHLDAAVPCESLPQHTTVLAQQLARNASPMLVQQPRRPLDVREQERHGPRRQVPWHARSIVDDFPLDSSKRRLPSSCACAPDGGDTSRRPTGDAGPAEWRRLVDESGDRAQSGTSRSERDSRPDGALHERVREACSEAMYCLPAGAMRGH